MLNHFKLKKYSSKKLFVAHILSALLIIFISVSGTYYWQKNASVKTREQRDNENIVSAPISEPTPTIEIKDFSVIENIFKEISQNNIEFNSKRDSVTTYKGEYLDLQEYIPKLSSPTYLQVNVYKYQPGAKFNGAYEGGEWVVNLDEWKQWLQDLGFGENTIKTSCGDWGCNKLDDPEVVTVKNINGNKYFVGDGSFPPGGNFNRYYTSFNPKNNTIIDVRLDYYLSMDSIEMLGIFSKIESLLP